MCVVLPLSADVRALVAAYAAYAPTPTAAAMRAHLVAHPWIEDVAALYPEKHVGTIILRAPYIGLDTCWKCNHCAHAKLYDIRRRYEPDERTEDMGGYAAE